MGFEYQIRFQPSRPEEVERCLEHLRTRLSLGGPTDEFTVSLEPDGFYFCDHTKSDRSSCAFRHLVDVALAYSDEVVIVEP